MNEQDEDTQVDWVLMIDSAKKLADLRLIVKEETNERNV
jgi:hypothetical protein